jgi:hypothetical protein
VRNEEALHRVKKKRNILHTKQEGRLTGLITYCVGTVFYNTLLKEKYK